MKLQFILLAGFALAASTALSAEDRASYDRLAANPDHLGAADRLHRLFQIDWERGLRESPEFGTDLGYPGSDDHWTDMSEAAIARRKAEAHWPLDVLKTIDRPALPPSDQLDYDLFRRNAELGLEDQKFPGEFLAVNQLGGVQQSIPQTLEQMPRATVQAYENILARMRAAPAVIEQNLALLRRGVAAGIVEPRIVMRDVPAQVLNVIPDDPMASALLRPFQDFPTTIPAADRDRLKAAAIQTYREQLVPAYRKLHDYLVQEYLPKTRESIAWSALPNGTAWYRLAVREQTTTEMTPEEIHNLGLAEVKRIRGEMEKVAVEAGYPDRLDDFIQFLRTDPRFYYTNAAALLSGYRDIAKRIDPELSRLFGRLPRLTYGVKAIPAYAAGSAPAAYYEGGSEKIGRPGWFCANTSNLAGRPTWQMETLTLHESVPGHHLQISLAQEMEHVPEFRKYTGYTAYVEGWALYCEGLGGELGLYRDAYTRFGALTFEMWRAARLVVDTGLHAQGWTRRQAIDYLMQNAGKDEHDATVEIDRYIVSPGQALAYKIGQLKIRALRDEAQRALGGSFDLRAFHDMLLAQGALPLDVLETRVKTWIAAQPKP